SQDIDEPGEQENRATHQLHPDRDVPLRRGQHCDTEHSQRLHAVQMSGQRATPLPIQSRLLVARMMVIVATGHCIHRLPRNGARPIGKQRSQNQRQIRDGAQHRMTLRYRVSLAHRPPEGASRGESMSKGMDRKKESKKKPAKTLEEKRAEKRGKKASKALLRS